MSLMRSASDLLCTVAERKSGMAIGELPPPLAPWHIAQPWLLKTDMPSEASVGGGVEAGGFGFVPIVSIAEVVEADGAEVSLFAAGCFCGIGVFGTIAGGGAFAGAAVDGAVCVVAVVAVSGFAAGFVP